MEGMAGVPTLTTDMDGMVMIKDGMEAIMTMVMDMMLIMLMGTSMITDTNMDMVMMGKDSKKNSC